MIKALFLPKQSNDYTDIFALLALAQIAEDSLRRTQQNTEMQLIDEGKRYRIQFATPIDILAISQLKYTNPSPPVRGQKTEWKNIPEETSYFDVVKEREKRKLYREYRYQNGGKAERTEESPPPPDARTQNGAILVSMRHDRNHNSLWLECWNLRNYYGIFISSLLEAFSQENQFDFNKVLDTVVNKFKKQTKKDLPNLANAVKIYLPTAVQGVSRVKADSNKTDPQKTDWLSLWLIANGFFEFGISEKIKITDRVYDWRVVALVPKDISLDKYREVLNILRRFNPPNGNHGVARFDIELILKSCQQLLENNEAKARGKPENPFDFWGKPVNEFVDGFRGTHFVSKGQVYGVKELFSLGLPSWIVPDNYQELLDYQNVLKEHLSVITSLSAEDKENHSVLLATYRDFITGITLQNFFRFQISYTDYIVKKLADSKSKPPRLFTISGLDIMTKKNDDYTKITNDPSFRRIAKSINHATVYAGKVRTKDGTKELDWQRNYGLAQQLFSQSGSKKDFVCAITEFIAKYEHENMRLAEKLDGKPLMRVWTTQQDLDRLIELINDFDHTLVANLLIAYGYANWKKTTENLPEGTVEENIATDDSDDSDDSDE
jgi:hypothetical protein